jgi:hypothetical protein
MYDPPHFNRAARRLHSTRQFRQQAVAGIFDGTAMVLFDLRIEELAEMRLEPFVLPSAANNPRRRPPGWLQDGGSWPWHN